MRKKNINWIFLGFILLFSIVMACPPNCLFCLNKNKCLTCHEQYFLTVNGQCTAKSVENCQVYSQDGKCAVCVSTFRVNGKNNQCVKDFSGCLRRDDKGNCVECGFGTTLNIKGECLGVVNCLKPQAKCTNCRNGYRLADNKCIYAGPECQIVHPSGLCQQCAVSYILNGFECLSRASSSVQSGNLNLISNCALYSRNENNCLECSKGYKLFNGQCRSEGQVYGQTIKKANTKIRQQSDDVFVDSKSEFISFSKVLYSLNSSKKDDYLDPEQREVSSLTFQGVGSAPNSTSDNCLIRQGSSLACSLCVDGFFSFNGLCKPKTVVCKTFNPTTNRCERCGSSFALLNGQCLDAGCDQYLYAQCARCKPGFQINQEGYCYDPYCLTKEDGQCVKCLAGYEVDKVSLLCFESIEGCEVYSGDKSLCQKCTQGYDIWPNGTCTRAEDERCLIYDNINSNLCTRCRDELAILEGTCIDMYCRVFQNPTKCTLCKEGYILHPQKYYCYDQNCVLYSNGTCINCANNYILQDGFCVNILIGCKRVSPGSQKCVQCLESYRLADGKCLIVDNQRCVKYANSLCVQCKMQFALVNGTCVDVLCEKQMLANNMYVCTQCKSGYSLTTGGVCYDEYCFRSVAGICAKCIDDYMIGDLGLCVKSTVGCLRWVRAQNRCQQCAQGYILGRIGVCNLPTPNPPTNQTTNNSSPNQMDPSTSNNTTNPSVADNPQTLNPNTPKTDIYCKQFSLTNPLICSKCIDGRYFIRNYTCLQVPDVCRGFDVKSGNCTSCEPNYAVYSEKSPYQDCYKKIPTADPNCLLRNLNSFCIKCRPQFYIKNGFCYQADTQCKTFDFYGGDCLTCYEGFTLQYNKCVLLTQQSRCKQYDFQNVCIQCEQGYFVAQGGICTEVMPTCLSYEMIGGACLSCSVGNWPLNGICVKVRDPTPNCKQTNQLGECVQCLDRFYVESVSLTCKPVNNLCNEYNMQTGACFNCVSGYKLRQELGLCVLQTSDDLCAQFNQLTGTCVKCQDNYTLAQSTLKCLKQIPYCSLYNQQTAECQKCQQPFALSFKQCVQKSKRQGLDPNCLLGDTYNYCIKCKAGYFISFGYCMKANDLCKTFNMNTGACETCYDGFIVKDKLCVDASKINTDVPVPFEDNCLLKSGSLCLKCKDRFFMSYEGSLLTCIKVNDTCLTYNELNGNCYTCINGYNLSTNGQCVINQLTPSQNQTSPVKPPSYVDVPQIYCKQYDLAEKLCHKCYSGYYYAVRQFACKLLNVSCKTAEPVTKICTSCYEGCLLNATKCVPASTILKVPGDRLSYSTVDILQFNPYCIAILDSKCIQCQAGYYVDIQTNMCLVEHQWCDTYKMIGGQCTKCKLGALMMPGNICVKPVMGIDPYCSTYNGAYCVACMQNYVLTNYVCKKAA